MKVALSQGIYEIPVGVVVGVWVAVAVKVGVGVEVCVAVGVDVIVGVLVMSFAARALNGRQLLRDKLKNSIVLRIAIILILHLHKRLRQNPKPDRGC
jgi:hypothetical protein